MSQETFERAMRENSFRARMSGHARTLAPSFFPVGRGREPERTIRFALEDPDVGQVNLSGALREVPGSRECVVLIHGLGGSSESYYCRAAANQAEIEGLSSLRLSLRGADREGEDFYNIALTADLHAALATEELRNYERIYIVGFSMGGHVVLHYACEARDPRVSAVVALCTPLDLKRVQVFFDDRCRWLYRQHVLKGLKSIYMAVAERRKELPTDPKLVAAVQTVHEWDRLTIAPRYGYDSPEAYYAELSVGPRLNELVLPSLLVAALRDPVIPQEVITASLNELDSKRSPLETMWVRRAGHIAFRRKLDLNQAAPVGLMPQLIAWLRAHS